jgi:hypothetical protein
MRAASARRGEVVMKAQSLYAMISISLGAALLAGVVSAQAADAAPAPEENPESGTAADQILRCDAPTSLLIDDLEDGDAVTPNGLGGWYVGPAPQLPSDASDLPVPGGPGRSRFAAHTTSPGGPETQAWVGVALGCSRDVRRLDGYRFAIKGTGSFYAKVVTLDTTATEFGGTCVEEVADPTTTNCSDHYSTTEPLTLTDDRWYECSVRFEDLDQIGWGTCVAFDRKAVTGIEIVPEWETAFDLTIDDVRFAAQVTRTGCRPLEPRHSSHRHHRR